MEVSGTNVDKVQGLDTLPPIPLTPLPLVVEKDLFVVIPVHIQYQNLLMYYGKPVI